jgi:hypothetical protein
MLECPINKTERKTMQYLILKHTPYEYIKDSFDIVSSTDNLDEANNRLQGYQLIDENKLVSYSILKYEKPLVLTKEVA